MKYYQCANSELRHEISRRGYQPKGSHDELSEFLERDDEVRGIGGTTVSTEPMESIPPDMRWRENPEFGSSFSAKLLHGESIVYWTMSTFFPTLQLFFDSGLSCTIDASHVLGASVGLNPALRFRLTDITHEENGRLVNSIMAKKFAAKFMSIDILEATIACRTSIAVKNPQPLRSTIVREQHVVVGLRLQGMKSMDYVYAQVPGLTVNHNSRKWGHVRIAGMRDDVPVPFVGFLQEEVKAGKGVPVVSKESTVRRR